ncbi:2,3-dihydro-2,3-dihydroxybenzoate dehydrogenase [Kitasatospora sp. NBC_00085]|uniref:2,3-dihydro-2,3-dihydroxybenzoate dehydrogenase n=1 Tax=unclassified Kitasatospora TaxID=2633591 RepID=UPI003254E36D
MKGTIALVTGAAGGIGQAVVRLLAERGAEVAAVDLDAERIAATAAALRTEGLMVTGFAADVTSSSAVDELVDEVETRLGPVSHLVNAAGVLRLGQARALSDQDWNATFAVNATGVFHVSRAVVNRMIHRGAGAIVTVASNSAGTARAEMAAYAASKAAATAFTKCLGLEVAHRGIRCNVVAPGSTDTMMLRGMHSAGTAAKASITGNPEQYRVGIPLGKVARPEDIARTVAFLLSDEAGHITMHELTVDGGATLGV